MRLFIFLACAVLGCLGQDANTYRPQFHFSPHENWTNDPNGLVYFEGEYHLFFQYNPFGDEWGHMSWGHAVSRDLLHWDQLPVALPEQDGIMIFTGSTVIDQRNTSGFCAGGKPCLVAVYTGHTPENGSRPALQTQNLAYSNDRSRTWTKFKGNPVLDLHMSDFRDPKVFWSDESKQWIMAVSLPNDHKVRLYGSPDLKQWRTLSDFGPAGATSGQWECPELFQLPVDNGHESRWVLKVGLNPGALQGGSGEQYFVGRFDGSRFTNDNPSSLTLWTDYGKDCYCALTFNGLPRGENPVMIGWMDNWQYAAKLPTSPWRGQMTAPRKLSLRTTSEGIRLFQGPIDSIQKLRTASSQQTKAHAFEMKSSVPLGTAQEVGWKILAADRNFTIVGYDRQAGKIFVDRTHSGLTGFSKDFPARTEAPLALADNVLRLDILVDRCSVEVFAEDGRIAMTNLVFPPPSAGGIEMYSKGGQAGAASVKVWEIRPGPK
ncbi:MAG: glycoside hydrolase family 32 protein [Acidobacteriaceae bacterium]|nr:glycoside hydrolase family 32 protein [Acidobacteriaceae bacterium]MBV9293969.1 glycoside hydrolase family 32 protein [Acidobacteriaceae bacterium]MBV9765687.1 glycoside hydrolase family 32 protein [Acidobacteriaceae bacterium]